MFILPALTVLISLVFAGQVLNQYRSRGRPHQLAWGLALLFYAVAAFPEVTGSLSGWHELEYRIYYLFGGILLVPWLALGTAELLLRSDRARPARLGYRAFVSVISLVGVAAVVLAPLHAAHLNATPIPINCTMWCSPGSETGYLLANGLAAASAAIGNIVGTLVLVVGAGYSAYRAYRAGLHRNLVMGNVLILAGALVVAAIASLTRINLYTLFYAGQAAGIAIIFAGFLVIGAATQARTQAI
ncbi:MAG TPA: hypothetical protein VG329_02695 [Candidatus Dormibacteraeota bacterium]|jgi:hypothetical protein|nr:hypothetical protein [Candidatus Dormibacteraeota bacterium]